MFNNGNKRVLFEYRAWPDHTEAFSAAIREQFTLHKQEERTDQYFLATDDPEVLPKIRGGNRLEIKVKVGETGSIARWRRQFSQKFPLDDRSLDEVNRAFPRVVLSTRDLKSPERLCRALHQSYIECALAKRRLLFRTAHCSAEITDVTVHGRTAVTIALEGESAAPVETFLSLMGSPLLPNEDYGIWLNRAYSEVIARPPGALRAAGF